MLEHNQIILRRRVANCIYGRLNTKQIEVEPVDIVSSQRITETKIPLPTKLTRNCFFFRLQLSEMQGSTRRKEEKCDFRLASSNSQIA